jgi:hypothetical protein
MQFTILIDPLGNNIDRAISEYLAISIVLTRRELRNAVDSVRLSSRYFFPLLLVLLLLLLYLFRVRGVPLRNVENLHTEPLVKVEYARNQIPLLEDQFATGEYGGEYGGALSLRSTLLNLVSFFMGDVFNGTPIFTIIMLTLSS